MEHRHLYWEMLLSFSLRGRYQYPLCGCLSFHIPFIVECYRGSMTISVSAEYERGIPGSGYHLLPYLHLTINQNKVSLVDPYIQRSYSRP